jgi:hypothetical protein
LFQGILSGMFIGEGTMCIDPKQQLLEGYER